MSDAKVIKSSLLIDEKEGYELKRVLYTDGSVGFVLNSPEETCQTKGSGKEGIKEVLEVWRNKLSTMDKTCRNERIKSLQKKHKDMLASEDDTQGNMAFNETEEEGEDE